jgi:E3 ubiquitin-protein ligase BRE1
MRQKEAAEGERKNLTRTIEKQAKAVERLALAEEKLLAQVVRVVVAVCVAPWRSSARVGRARTCLHCLRESAQSVPFQHRRFAERLRAVARAGGREALTGHATNKRDLSDVRGFAQARDGAASTTRRGGQDESGSRTCPCQGSCAAADRGFIVVARGASAGRDRQVHGSCFFWLQRSLLTLTRSRCLQSILKCSTCKMRMRSTVITKCMHCAQSLLLRIRQLP